MIFFHPDSRETTFHKNHSHTPNATYIASATVASPSVLIASAQLGPSSLSSWVKSNVASFALTRHTQRMGRSFERLGLYYWVFWIFTNSQLANSIIVSSSTRATDAGRRGVRLYSPVVVLIKSVQCILWRFALRTILQYVFCYCNPICITLSTSISWLFRR